MNRPENLKIMVSTDAYIDNPAKIYSKGAIVFPKNGAAVSTNKKRILGQDSVVDLNTGGFLADGNQISTTFLFYLLQHVDFKQYVRGGAVPTLDLKELKNKECHLPPISEQERIVAELDLLQGIIDKQKAQLKELDTLAQSIFYDMFQHEHGQVVKLHDVCSIVSGLVSPNEEPYCNYPHIGGANVESGTGVFINVKLAKEENLISGKYLFDETMILYSKIRPNLNKVALPSFVGICSADMYPIIPDRDKIDRTFLKFVLSQPDFLEYAVSHSGRANIPKINREDLMDYSFTSYSLSLQQSFATKIEAIEHQKASINASIAETQKLFDYTMDKYFG